MRHFIRALAIIIAFTFAVPNTASAYTLFERLTVGPKKQKKVYRATKRKKTIRKKRRRISKKQRLSKKQRRAKSRRISRARAKRAKANRIAAAKRRALYSRKNVRYFSKEKRGTIIIDTRTRHLYHITGRGKATRYGVAVGKQGFSWSGTSRIRRKVKWPTWTPPKEMIERKPKLAKWANGQPGGPANPLGAAALYLYQGKRDTLYRIHGTNNPRSIGRAASSGCIRMKNEDIQHLYSKVGNGTKVIVR